MATKTEATVMWSWVAKRLLERNMARLNAGDMRPLTRLYARDVRFRFPGDSSWACEIDSKADLERWLQRFIDTGLQIFPDEVVAQGPPWNTTLCVRGRDHLDRDGERLYDNRYVIWGRMRWGLMREYEVYEDTQASKLLDERLGAGAPA